MSYNEGYIRNNIIRYLGNKRKLLPQLEQAIKDTQINTGTFVDLFSGSGVVSKLAKTMGYRVIANDIEKYSQTLNINALVYNTAPITNEELNHINNLPDIKGYMYDNYSPIGGRWFYTEENAMRLDSIREYAETLPDCKKIAVVSSLLYRASIHSNTSGQFRAFHNGWGGQTKTNVKEIVQRIVLSMPAYFDNDKQNLVFCEDANKLAPNIKGDIVYLDPPYNEHIYGSFYHILNTLVIWDKFDVGLVTTKKRKAGLRFDAKRTAYNEKNNVSKTLVDLLESIRARVIILSYSDQGHISTQEMHKLVDNFGTSTWKEIPYRMYSSSKTRVSKDARPHEYIITIKK